MAVAVPDSPHPGDTRPDVLDHIAPSLDEANRVMRELMIELGEKVRARGDRVVDVET